MREATCCNGVGEYDIKEEDDAEDDPSLYLPFCRGQHSGLARQAVVAEFCGVVAPCSAVYILGADAALGGRNPCCAAEVDEVAAGGGLAAAGLQ